MPVTFLALMRFPVRSTTIGVIDASHMISRA